MNQKVLSFSVAATFFVTGFTLAADMPAMDMSPQAPTSQPTQDTSAVDLGNTICPVSGDKVGDSKLTANYDGKIYHLCCGGCPKKFAEDPATYAKTVAADPAKYGVKSK